MLELITFVLFQLISSPNATGTPAQPPVTSPSFTGNGGWGHDIVLPTDTVRVSGTGNGGWGHD